MLFLYQNYFCLTIIPHHQRSFYLVLCLAVTFTIIFSSSLVIYEISNPKCYVTLAAEKMTNYENNHRISHLQSALRHAWAYPRIPLIWDQNDSGM